jgi:hypothetical protein
VGPWTPIRGIDVAYRTAAEYEEGKAKCTLDFYTGGRY